MNNPIISPGTAQGPAPVIPASGAAQGPAPVVSVSPVVLSAPGRGADLQVRVSAPVTGRELPIVVFAHGFGSSSDGYAPLAHFWAARGFVVLQPTFLDSRTLGLGPDDPRTPRIWRFRIEDVKRTLDQIEHLETSVPGLAGRVDRSRISVAGHSFGAQTTGVLLGARVIDPDWPASCADLTTGDHPLLSIAHRAAARGK